MFSTKRDEIARLIREFMTDILTVKTSLMKNITTFDLIIRVEKCPGLSKDELTRSKESAILKRP